MTAGLREVTERRLQEIELRKALEQERELRALKSRFVSMVSHEFRTPLTTILSSSEIIREYDRKLPEDKKRKHFKRIQTAVSQMKYLMEDVLFLGKTETGRLEFHPTQVNLLKFCLDIVEEMQAIASDMHTILFTNTAEDTVALIDEKLLHLAISNLLSNAIKYSPNGGRIKFDLRYNDGNFVFRIKDQGIGVPKQDQKRLFETFYRADNVAHISGTGLGLYITKMAVDLHSGRIRFRSQEGVGTTVIVAIPHVRIGG
jgi:signal transduction histidine kinase